MTQDNLIPARRALITGGVSGFGWAIAQALLAQGAQVAIGDNHADRLAAATASLPNANRLALELDVTSPAAARTAVAACEARLGGLDTLVNSAGIIYFTPLYNFASGLNKKLCRLVLHGILVLTYLILGSRLTTSQLSGTNSIRLETSIYTMGVMHGKQKFFLGIF